MTYGGYFALAAALTVLGGIWTWFSFRRRGLRSGIRAFGITLLAPAAYLTGVLKMLGRILHAIADWAVALVFSPTVWLGFIVAIVAMLAIYVSGRMPKTARPAKRVKEPKAPKPVPGGSQGGDTIVDDDSLADVSAILKKHGIS